MFDRFVRFVDDNHLIPRGGTILLAVSGGIDSVSLCELTYMAGYNFAIAHCNFHLRGSDSDRDEQFVRNLAQRYEVPCFVDSFETEKVSAEWGMSIEETARKLRYDFFDSVLDKQGYSAVATAHHRDDATETLFINLLRGTGISGLHGIRPRNGRVIRPMLPFSREEISAFASERGLEHVEDSTNASTQFLRNRIRHQVLPLLRQISPAVDKTMQQNIAHFAEAEQIYRQRVEEVFLEVFDGTPDMVVDANRVEVPIDRIDALEPQHTLFYELLKPFSFSSVDADTILSCLHKESGRQFFSATHRLLVDRNNIIIVPITEEVTRPDISYSTMSRGEVDSLKTASSMIYIDADAAKQPFHLRHWQSGDRFFPFGGKGSRLVSDFFIDKKLSIIDKERVWLLCDSDDRIIWIVGYRADNRFRVTDKTQNIIAIRCNTPI